MANDARTKRPLSVWVLTILNGVLAAFMIAASFIAENFGYSGGQAALSAVFGLAISISAHATWYGYRWGRLALLLTLTIFLGQLIVWSVMVINWSEETGYRGPLSDSAMPRVVGSLIWLALNWILLFGKKSRAFFA
jgi:hypothetical protein